MEPRILMKAADSPRPHLLQRLRAISSVAVVCLSLGQFTMQCQVWTPTSAPVTNWFCVASSATGSNLFAGGRGPYNGNDGYPEGPIYVSHDAGLTWSESGAPIAT